MSDNPRGARRRLFSTAGPLVLASALVVPSASPAQGTALGGGHATGTINYVGKPLPKVLSLCERNLAFTLGSLDDPEAGWHADAFVVTAPGTEYEGAVTITGTGGSDISCESYSLAGGVLTLSLAGSNPLTGATLACNEAGGDRSRSTPLTGRYVRSASDLTATLTGRCLVNGVPTGQLTFLLSAEAVPRDIAGGEGTTKAVRSLLVSGVFVRSSWPSL